VTLVRHVARLHGVDRRWLLMLSGAWLIVVLAARFGLPQVDPDPVDRSHPFETLSTFALLLPVMAQISALTIYAPWVESVRAVHIHSLQATWLALQWCCGVLVITTLSLVALPYGVDIIHAAGVWAFLFSIASLAASARTESSLRFSALALFAVLSIMTLPGLLPWSANLLYNGETTSILWVLAAVLTAAAMALPVLRRQ